jgi:D-alanine-D-alanine ligase
MNHGKTTIVVVFGGKSPEHTVAFKSGLFIMSFLDPERFHVHGVYIKRDGSFATPREKRDAIKFLFRETHHPITRRGTRSLPISRMSFNPMPSMTGTPTRMQAISSPISRGALRCRLPGLHGKNGEDGTSRGFSRFSSPLCSCD